jgi:hypothetical protein
VPSARRCLFLVWLAVAAGAPGAVLGHEVPSDATIQIIVRPAGERLQVLVRAPLEAMQDIEFPTFGPGYLDLARADQALRNAALVWLADNIGMYEQGRRLPRLDPVAIRVSIPSDRSFASFDTALAHLRGSPLPDGTQLVWQQALLDVLLEAPIGSASSAFALDARLERLGMV